MEIVLRGSRSAQLAEVLSKRKTHQLDRFYGDNYSEFFAEPEDEARFQIDANLLQACGAIELFQRAANSFSRINKRIRIEGLLRPDKRLIHLTTLRATWGFRFGSNNNLVNEARVGVSWTDEHRMEFIDTWDTNLARLYFYRGFQGDKWEGGVTTMCKPDEVDYQLSRSFARPYKAAVFYPTIKDLIRLRNPRIFRHFEKE